MMNSESIPPLTPMMKIEIVVSGGRAKAVHELIRQAGATGYTSLSGVSGLGHHGQHQGQLLFNEQENLQMLITVVPHGKAGPLITSLRTLLEDIPGVMFVSETSVSRSEYFT